MEDRVHGTEGLPRRGVSVRFLLAAEKAVKQMARWNLIRVVALLRAIILR